MVAEADATGTATVVLAYGPFGEVHRGYGSGATLPLADIRQPFRFTGQMRDAATGLSYHRARYYSAALGRFLSPDPLGYADGFNLYAYVGNDPVNFADPGGMYAERAANWIDEQNQVTKPGVDAAKIATIKYAGYAYESAKYVYAIGKAIILSNNINSTSLVDEHDFDPNLGVTA